MSSVADVAAQLRTLGVERGGVLLVHTAYRAVRPVEGGPSGLIAALTDALGPEGTLVIPSWTEDDDHVFDPRTTPAARDLGITAEVFRRMPGVLRSDHPFAFAARGPHAETITADPLPIPPHIEASPVGRVHDLDGQVLLLGVGHDADTTVHLGELLGGAPYRLPHHVTVHRQGRPTRIDYLENDCCCERFALVDAWLGDRQCSGQVGQARSRLARSRDIVAAVRSQVSADPLIFLHPATADCEECNQARASRARDSRVEDPTAAH